MSELTILQSIIHDSITGYEPVSVSVSESDPSLYVLSKAPGLPKSTFQADGNVQWMGNDIPVSDRLTYLHAVTVVVACGDREVSVMVPGVVITDPLMDPVEQLPVTTAAGTFFSPVAPVMGCGYSNHLFYAMVIGDDFSVTNSIENAVVYSLLRHSLENGCDDFVLFTVQLIRAVNKWVRFNDDVEQICADIEVDRWVGSLCSMPDEYMNRFRDSIGVRSWDRQMIVDISHHKASIRGRSYHFMTLSADYEGLQLFLPNVFWADNPGAPFLEGENIMTILRHRSGSPGTPSILGEEIDGYPEPEPGENGAGTMTLPHCMSVFDV